jgi:hypothetical protein
MVKFTDIILERRKHNVKLKVGSPFTFSWKDSERMVGGRRLAFSIPFLRSPKVRPTKSGMVSLLLTACILSEDESIAQDVMRNLPQM